MKSSAVSPAIETGAKRAGSPEGAVAHCPRGGKLWTSEAGDLDVLSGCEKLCNVLGSCTLARKTTGLQ